MRAIKFIALAGCFALVAAACQSAPQEASNVPTEEAAAADNAQNEAAGAEPASAAADAPNERPEPQAPRAEGDRLAELLASEDYLLLDVRRPDELEERGTVEGYLNIPIEELADRLGEVPRDRPVLTA